jgi:putative tryptophan/tyrosine transport system substrate-binding protein
MRRRGFVAGFAITAAWSLLAHAQQGERLRRIAMLQGGAVDPQSQPNTGAFLQALQQLGWTDGRNVRI